MPATSRDFLNAAEQRLTCAEVLMSSRQNLDAQYLGGYAVECSLKAIILESTSVVDRVAKLKEITSGAIMHRPEFLIGELRDLGVVIPPLLAKRIRRFKWTTDLRYQVGRRDTGETKAFLNTARAILNWAKGELA